MYIYLNKGEGTKTSEKRKVATEMMNIDQDRMQQVIQEAFDKTNSLRWQTAIAKAKQQLESNPYMHFDGDALLILSDSNTIYRANGTCQCRAYEKGFPCWHRAAARLVERYNEASREACGAEGEAACR
jgi:hypothetical protein